MKLKVGFKYKLSKIDNIFRLILSAQFDAILSWYNKIVPIWTFDKIMFKTCTMTCKLSGLVIAFFVDIV